MTGFLLVFLGGGLGAALRHGVNILSARWLGLAFPYATLIENVSGSLLMGILAGYFAFKGDAASRSSWPLWQTWTSSTDALTAAGPIGIDR